MELEANFIPEKGYIKAIVTGDFYLEDIRQAAKHCLKIAKKQDCHNYLIDSRKGSNQLSTLEMIFFVTGLVGMGFSYKDKVAFVIKSDLEKYNLAETIARNRGWGRLGYFSEILKAEEWLIDSS